MITILEKEYLVSDWMGAVKTIKAKTINEAVTKYLGEPVVPTQDTHSSSAFGCELSEDVSKEVLSKESGVYQAEALAAHPGVSHFAKVNA